MKILLHALITLGFLEIAIGQTANKIDVIDTRYVNDAPTDFSYEARFHFKQSSVVGLPSSAFYSGVMTFAPWGDNSGNKHHQLGFNEAGLFWRTGQPQSSSWDSWNRLVTADANGRVGLGLSDLPVSTLDVSGTVTFRRQGNASTGISVVDGAALSLRGWGTYNPYIEWVNSNNVRQGYLGWNTDRLSLALESNFNFTIENGKVGIGLEAPQESLHVNGTIGIGKMSNYASAGLRVDYVDGGSGTTVFKHLRWGGDVYFKREGSSGERTQLYFGGSNNHLMDLYDGNNEVKVRLNSAGDSYYMGGNVGIGTTTPGSFKLAVEGKVWAQEVQVALTNPGPDYVFEPNYKLLSLEEIKSYIEKHKHLPEVPSAKEMETNGVNVSEMNMLLLKKIEELTLHIIRQDDQMRLQNEKYQSQIDKLVREIEILNNKK